MKLTSHKLKDMKAKCSANKSKLKVCRKDVKAKRLTGDDRWFISRIVWATADTARRIRKPA